MLKPIILLSGGPPRSTADGLGHAPGLYDFNGDGIEDIVIGPSFAFEDAAGMIPAELLALRDIAPDSPAPARAAAETGDAPAAAFAIPAAEIPAAFEILAAAAPPSLATGHALQALAARYDGLFDLTADHFLL